MLGYIDWSEAPIVLIKIETFQTDEYWKYLAMKVDIFTIEGRRSRLFHNETASDISHL